MTAESEATDEAPADRPPYGLRGWLLLLYGSVWLTWGITLVLFTSERSGAALYDVVTTFMPLHAWGIVWTVVGAAGALCGVFRRHAWGFLVLSLLPGFWGVGLMAATFTAGSPSGLPLGWTFVALGGAIALTSRMEDARFLLRKVVAS